VIYNKRVFGGIKQIVNALSEMNGLDVLKGTQNSKNEKSPDAY